MFRKYREDLLFFAFSVVSTLVFFFPGWIKGNMFIMTDFLTATYPFHKMASELPIPKWDPYIFGGMPFWGAPHADVFYINQIFRFITDPGHAASLSMVFHSIWAYIFGYLFLRKLGVDKGWAFLLSVAYSTATFWTSLVFSGHLAKMSIICNLPAIFWALEGTLEGKVKYAALLGLFAGITTNAGHAQLIYYTFIAVLIYALGWIIYSLRQREYNKVLKVVLYGVFSLAIAIAISSPFLWNQWEYIRGYSLRGEVKGIEFSKSWSLDWADFFSMFFGMYSGVFEKYWGSNPFKINSEYLGAILVFFGIIGIITNFKNWRVISLSVALFILFVLMTAKVNPLFPLFYEFFPMVKLFRAQSMASGVFGFLVFALGAFAFKDIERLKELAPKVIIGGLIVGLFLLMFGKSLTIWGFESDMQRLAIFSATSTDRFFAISKTLVIWFLAYMLIKGNPKSLTTPFFLAIIGFTDNFLSKSPFYKPINENVYFAKDDIAAYLEENKGIYRVLDLGYKMDDNYLVLFGIQMVGGHHGQHMKTYYEYLKCEGLMFNPFLCEKIRNNPEVLDTLGVKFVIAPMGLKGEVQNYPEFSKFGEYIQKYKAVYSNQRFEILKNPDYFPRFFLMCGDSVEKNIKVLNYYPRGGFYEVEYSSDKPCKLVLTENYYHHWKAFVDGKATNVERFRGTFMAINAPIGRHRVKFIYESPLENLTLNLFFVGIAVSLAGFLIGWRFRI
ncbi:MAG: hypothetical protein ABIL41_02050 [candidate division WOR-3 bacterium]